MRTTTSGHHFKDKIVHIIIKILWYLTISELVDYRYLAICGKSLGGSHLVTVTILCTV